MSEDISGRGKQILEAIIEDYILTAEPVGSRAVTRRHGLAVSPATVRNVMSDLEEMGYLASPHTSAGRVPTEKAYRMYVNSLLQVGLADAEQQERLREKCTIAGREVSEILKETGRMLSFMSHYTGIVLAPRFRENTVRHLEFVKLGGKRILVIMVTDQGIVQNKLIEPEEEFSAADLARMSNYLNELLYGLPVAEVKERLLREMRDDKVMYDELLANALRLSEASLPDDSAELIIEGRMNILDQPEFSDTSKMREIFQAFEEKGQLLDLLDRCLNADGIQIFIGSETHLARMEGISVIASSYRRGDRKLGVLGVIGPTRMEYATVIPIVDYTAKLVSRLLQAE